MDNKPARLTEDWLAVYIGLLIFVLALGAFWEADILGWAVTTSVWTKLPGSLGTASKSFAGLPGWLSLLLTYLFLLLLLTAGSGGFEGRRPALY